MMVKVITADKDQHAVQIRELFLEHLQWANAKVKEEFEVSFNTAAMLEGDMKDLDKFMPPQGRLLLAYNENRLAGIACLKALTFHIGEIKRMYVRPGNRKQGLGRALLNRLLEEACQIGYEQVRLDSAPFMTEAHHLYRTAGFTEIDAYEGSEVPKELQGHWIFMENVFKAQSSRLKVPPTLKLRRASKVKSKAVTSDLIFKSTNIWTRGAINDYKEDGFDSAHLKPQI